MRKATFDRLYRDNEPSRYAKAVLALPLETYAGFLDSYPPALIDDHRELFSEGLSQLTAEQGGDIYICQHSAWPGLYKIGCTQRGARERVAQLKTAGVLGHHELLRSWWHFDARALEAQVHAALRLYRQASSEWFCAPFTVAVDTIEAAISEQQARAARILSGRLS